MWKYAFIIKNKIFYGETCFLSHFIVNLHLLVESAGKYNLDTIVNNLKQFIRENVSLDSIVKKYVEGFNLVLRDE